MPNKSVGGKSRRGSYVQVTPQLLAILTVKRIKSYVGKLQEAPENWWFAIQDVDLALTSQMIASLSGSAQLGALIDAHQSRLLEYYNERNPAKSFPLDKKGQALEGQIASFATLLSRAENPQFAFIDNSHNFLKITDMERQDILKLHEFRSDLAHPRPLTWSVQIAGLPRMAKACFHALQHLFEHSTQKIHLTATHNKQMERDLSFVLKSLESMS